MFELNRFNRAVAVTFFCAISTYIVTASFQAQAFSDAPKSIFEESSRQEEPKNRQDHVKESFWINAPQIEKTPDAPLIQPQDIDVASAQSLATIEPAAGPVAYNDTPSDFQKINLHSDENTLFRLTPDKIKIVNLDREPDSVIIGNEQHLSIFFDTQKRAALVPRQPGSSYFQIYDADGSIIVQGHAIIAGPKQNYVRVRRTCANGGDDCQTTSVYFCPDMCHEVLLPPTGETAQPQDSMEGMAQNTASQASQIGQDDERSQ